MELWSGPRKTTPSVKTLNGLACVYEEAASCGLRAWGWDVDGRYPRRRAVQVSQAAWLDRGGTYRFRPFLGGCLGEGAASEKAGCVIWIGQGSYNGG